MNWSAGERPTRIAAVLILADAGQITSDYQKSKVKPWNQKYFPSPATQIRCISKPSRPDRGALRNVINAGRDAVDALVSQDELRRRKQFRRRRWQKSPVTGESKYKP